MATHSLSILAWEATQTEEPGRLQSMGSWSWTPLGRHVGTLEAFVAAKETSHVRSSGTEPVSPAVEACSLNHWTTRQVPIILFF